MPRTRSIRSKRRLWVPASLVLATAFGKRAEAQSAAPTNPSTPSVQSPTAPMPDESTVEHARSLYLDGLRLVKLAQWGEALASFEKSNALRPHPMTEYNIGACERALGRYTRARAWLQTALADSSAATLLPASTIADATGFQAEIDGLLAHLVLRITPAGTGLSVDGRPPAPAAPGNFVAGTLPPGPGTPAPAGPFEVLLDPGAHVLTLSRKGYADSVVNRTLAPGSHSTLELELTRLPATIRISSNEPDALVTVSGRDVGPAPVDVLRPAGLYRVEVSKSDFVPYGADVRVNPGEEATLEASLVRERTPVTKKWWFWTAAALLVGGVATGTFLATRTTPKPERPALDGGNLDWVAPVQK